MELELQNVKADREFGAHRVHLLFVKLLILQSGKTEPQRGEGLPAMVQSHSPAVSAPRAAF